MYKGEIRKLQRQYVDNCLVQHYTNVLATAVEGMLAKRKRILSDMNKDTVDNTKVTVLTYGHFMRCEFVMNVTREALAKLQGNKQLYRQEVKRMSRRINAEIARMNGVMYNMMNSEDERYVDGYDYVMDSFSKIIKPDFDKLYYSILQAITNHAKEPQIYASIEAAGLLSAMCEACMEANKRAFTDYSFMNSIYFYNTRAITDMLSRLSQLVWGKIANSKGEDVDLKTNCNVRLAVNSLKYKFIDSVIVVNAYNQINKME